MSDSEETAPLLRIVKGEPTPEELAALVAVVSAMSARTAASGTPVRSRNRWGAPPHGLRGTHRPGPGAWRAQAR